MFIKILAPFCIVLFGQVAIAKKEMVFFGGGGEPDGANTIFDQTLQGLPLIKKNSGWSFKTFFDGGHAGSEALAQKVTGNKNQPLTAANMNGELDRLESRIRSGDLAAGDQLLLTISTHGAQTSEGQKTHSVAMINGELFDLDRLEKLKGLAEEKGVKLAIMDFSCHSGEMLNLGSDKTCVITAANANLGYISDSVQGTQAMREGRSLEDVFQFMKADPRGSPQISTAAGKRLYNELAYVTAVTVEGKSVDEAIGACEPNQQQGATELAENISEITQRRDVPPALEAKLRRYEQLRSEAEEMRRVVQTADARVCVGQPEICRTRSAWDRMANKKRVAAAQTTEQIRLVELATQVVNQLEHQGWRNQDTEAEARERILEQLSFEISEAENTVYKERYQRYSQESQAPNPCRDFAL